MKKFIWILGMVCLVLTEPTCAQIYSEVSSGKSVFNIKSKGVAIADFDNDGDDDIYLTTEDESSPNHLLRNDGNWQFTDISSTTGLDIVARSKTAIWVDLDGNGWLDLYVSNVNSADQLFRNNGDGTFENITSGSGVINQNTPFSVMCGDLNGDQWPDLYVANFLSQNNLLINQQNGTFRDEIYRSGAESILKDMGGVLYDYDQDGDLDIYLTHDGKDTNNLFQNDGTGHFIDVAPALGMDYEGFGMGVDFADFNQDGIYDLYITNLFDNILYMSDGNSFTEVATEMGLNDYGMSWGTVAFDHNNDSHTDLYMINEYNFSPYENILYENQGDGSFTNVSQETVLESKFNGFGGAVADFDQDGFMDLVVTNSTEPGTQIFRNEQTEGNWISFTLVGDFPNKFAVGTKIKVKVDDTWLIDELTVGSGYSSQNSHNIHFGLGQHESVEIEITWTDGTIQVFEEIAANERYLVSPSEEIQPFTVAQYQELLTQDVLQTVTSVFNTNNVSVWPVPTLKEIYIKTDNTVSDIKLLNLNGVVLPLDWDTQKNGLVIDMGNYDNGIYQLMIQTNKGREIRKIIKQ